MINAQTFDFPALLKRLQNEMQHACDLLEIFLQYEGSMFGAIKDALQQQDSTAIEFAAHRAKGALASIHAEVSRELSSQLERAGASGDLARANLVMPDLTDAWQALVTELNECVCDTLDLPQTRKDR